MLFDSHLCKVQFYFNFVMEELIELSQISQKWPNRNFSLILPTEDLKQLNQFIYYKAQILYQ